MKNYYIDDSEIHGKGVFINANLSKGTKIGKVIDYYYLIFIPYITNFLGKWINHSDNPNCKIFYDNEKKIYNLYTTKTLKKDSELVMNYNETPWYVLKPEDDFI